MHPHPQQVVEFWRAAGAQRWFVRDEAFDAECAARFLDAHHAAAQGEFKDWIGDAQGALALLILLDQIPRNIFRGSAHAWATDGLARAYAQRSLDAGFDTQVEPELRMFFYLPFEHSEDLADQERALFLHRALPGENADHWARLHHDIIAASAASRIAMPRWAGAPRRRNRHSLTPAASPGEPDFARCHGISPANARTRMRGGKAGQG